MRECEPCWGAESISAINKQHSVQFSSVAQSCPTLCDPMNRSTPGLPVHHQLPEFTQTLGSVKIQESKKRKMRALKD